MDTSLAKELLAASRLSQFQDDLAAMKQVERLPPGVLEDTEGVLLSKPEPPQRF